MPTYFYAAFIAYLISLNIATIFVVQRGLVPLVIAGAAFLFLVPSVSVTAVILYLFLNPVTDWRFYDSIYTERYMGLPQDNPAGYDAASPLVAADRLVGEHPHVGGERALAHGDGACVRPLGDAGEAAGHHGPAVRRRGGEDAQGEGTRQQFAAAPDRRRRQAHHLLPDDVDDAIAESYIAAWNAAESGSTIHNVDAFCTVVAKRHLIRRHHETQRHVYPDHDESFSWNDLEGASGMVQEPAHDYVVDSQELLGAAPHIYATILRMHYLEGLTFEAIAELLHVTSDCARKRHQRALRWARTHFRQEE